MTPDVQPRDGVDPDAADPDADGRPVVHACESCPGRSVFVEARNADGWIATDVTADVVR